MIKELSGSVKIGLEAIKEGHSLLLEGLWDAPLAYISSLILENFGRPILVISGGARKDQLFDDLSYFLKTPPIEFPAWETLPGEEIRPSPDILGKRFEALYKLIHQKEPSVVLCPIQALLQKIALKEDLFDKLLIWRRGSVLSFSDLPEKLIALGYKRAAVVSDKGEFAIRGGILDLFPTASFDPFRVEFFGDTIEQIRTFDPIGQRSIEKVEEFFLCPADELPLLQKAKSLGTIHDYLGDDPLIVWDDLLAIEDGFVALQKMPGSHSPFFLKPEAAFTSFKKNRQIFCSKEPIENLSPVEKRMKKTARLEEVSFEIFHTKLTAHRFFHPFQKVHDYFLSDEIEAPTEDFLSFFRPDPKMSLLFLNATETEEEALKKKLASTPLPSSCRFERGYLTSGFVITDIPFALIPNAEITNQVRIRRQKWRSACHTPAAEFHELSPGDLVVHFHSGIGKFLGMEKQVNHLGVETEFLVIAYAENSKLFVPLSQAYLVSRYIGSKEEPPSLSQLGSKRWHTTRMTAQAQIVGYANDLLQLYAERAAAGGFRFAPDSDIFRAFEEDFPYEETQDQFLAINAIKEDMVSSKAMDRLVCGDVGYGKTEVAMRAAFKAVVDGGKQVALLVPTTVLAMQHFETFSLRMQGFPVKVAVVSRFFTPKEMKETVKQTKEGKVDILIGTHRLLSKDVEFKNLGLIIIDEEQRFGVRAKEHLKKFKAGVDCLTLTATPIPRTLYMSLVSARDMSVISTPPQDRLPIKTIIAETDFPLIQNALLREFSREGQAFFIHNRVESIHARAAEIQKLVPQARIGVVHGQMDPDAVDEIFHKFKSGALNLLFATTIIENGIDVPNANTILIDRSDTYGVSDLYQLRGRVGRWNRSAYAYFLIPKHTRLPEIARKRLNALVESSGYGGGMKVAMRDLEIRGAGDLLGVQQSGHVSAIGFHLYCKLLKRAIDAIKQQKPISFHETKMEFSFDARLPDTYINEVSIRMEIYHRLGDAASLEEIDEILSEMKDRFGEPPLPVLWLYRLSRIRAFAALHSITYLKFSQLSLQAEQQKGKKSVKATILLPQKVQTLEKIEDYVVSKLKEALL